MEKYTHDEDMANAKLNELKAKLDEERTGEELMENIANSLYRCCA